MAFFLNANEIMLDLPMIGADWSPGFVLLVTGLVFWGLSHFKFLACRQSMLSGFDFLGFESHDSNEGLVLKAFFSRS